MITYFISIEQDSKGALTEKKLKNRFLVLGVLTLRLFSLEVKTSKTPIFAPFLKLRLSSLTSCFWLFLAKYFYFKGFQHPKILIENTSQ